MNLLIQVLIFFAPAFFAMAIIDKLQTRKETPYRSVLNFACFAFFIHFLTYAAVWIRGHRYLSWSAEVTHTQFVVKYMALSFIFATLLAFFYVGISEYIEIKKKQREEKK